MIVEDDKKLSLELKDLLLTNNYGAEILNNFKDSLSEILNYNPDLILLDINIPYLNGESLLKELRKTSNIPVIMVTSKNTEIDEVLSMSYGADDYITKPYNPTILLLRISAILKRIDNSINNLIYKDLIIAPNRCVLKNDKKEIELTKNEMIIFSYLLNNIGIIVSRDELMTTLWNNEEYINENALTVNISRLRSKLKDFGYAEAIETKKGQGYILL